MKPTMDELVKMMRDRVTAIEASRAPDMPEDVAAYQRWEGELNNLARRLGAIAADAEVSA